MDASKRRALIIDEMTWPELEAELEHIQVALVPVGSCEQHGPNTSFATDAARAYEFAKLAGERMGSKVVVFPSVNYGISQHHMPFPGTVTLRVETLMHLLEDIAISIHKHGIKRVLFLNAHGGNYPALDGMVVDLKQQYNIRAYWTPIGSEIYVRSGLAGSSDDFPPIIGHACEVETSHCMYLKPSIVARELRESEMQDSMYTRKSFVAGGTAWNWKYDVTRNGALGDARKSTWELGKAMTDCALNYVEKLVDEIIAHPDYPET